MIDPSVALAGLPKELRDTVIKCYQEIMSNYLERRWEPSELNGGKFSEAVYSIINGALKGGFPAKATKPTNMVTACRTLESEPADVNRVGDRSLRLLIPRVLAVLYEIRNNRGVGHVGGDVNANHMDAEAVQAMGSRVMAELVRVFHGIGTDEAQQTVDSLVERKTPLIWELEGIKRVLESGMSAKHQVLMFLHQDTGWILAAELVKWVEYSSAHAFRRSVLMPLHKERLIEFDERQSRARISPRGMKEVEENLLKPRAHGDSPKRRKAPRKRQLRARTSRTPTRA